MGPGVSAELLLQKPAQFLPQFGLSDSFWDGHLLNLCVQRTPDGLGYHHDQKVSAHRASSFLSWNVEAVVQAELEDVCFEEAS